MLKERDDPEDQQHGQQRHIYAYGPAHVTRYHHGTHHPEHRRRLIQMPKPNVEAPSASALMQINAPDRPWTPNAATTGIIMRLLGSLALGAALLANNPGQAHDSANGKVIAQVWCSNCHRIDATTPRTAHDATPSFATIAGKKSTTAASLAAFLKTRHGGMPDLSLSPAEIADVSAYILSLRGAR